ncbi:hypothetical protein O6H91_20G058500 [Diphasiastrum complanatum]|uniref:Uncharacterized protein n=1 Tax=Diphasiastrum complanatum TaxID=34168 RepID=A0ACC2ARU1_DIPCM|nr:hypothetical protein O6H91_20G058500 [Diphasiastrum complanatum]
MQIFMIERIWGRLPEGLVDAILAHLPIFVLLRLRVVCKRWNTLLSCPGFLHLCSQVPQERSYLLFTGLDFLLRMCIQEGLIFCPSSNRWHRLPLNFLPFPSENIKGVTGGGGLLLVWSALNSAEMVVTNPVTRAWKILPTFHRSSSRPSLAALVVNKSKATYKIVAAFDSDTSTYVYESSTNVWTKTAKLPFLIPKCGLLFAMASYIVYMITLPGLLLTILKKASGARSRFYPEHSCDSWRASLIHKHIPSWLNHAAAFF